jgi:transcription antitermination protein NusB
MQLLYAQSRDTELSLNDLLQRYSSYRKNTLALYLFNLHQWTEIAHYAVKDKVNRQAKLVPTEDDRRFTDKLYRNDWITSLIQADVYKKMLQKYPVTARIDADTTRLMYMEFAKTDPYKKYVSDPQAEHSPILLELYRFLCGNETFNEVMEDHFPSWIDDKTLFVGATKKLLKGLPKVDELVSDYEEEDLMTLKFGEQLLVKTLKKEAEILEYIKPMLQNWDAERVAVIDMILLKLATSEFLDFPTIPTKVTLNEYVDLSKLYSTDKSKEFVNGILDKLLKKLKEEGKVSKEGRGLVE